MSGRLRYHHVGEPIDYSSKTSRFWVSYGFLYTIALAGLVCGILGIIFPMTSGESTLQLDARLANNDTASPQVRYTHAFTGADWNTWYMGPNAGFDPGLVPGVVSGDGGQGNLGTNWTVPAVGEYHFWASCTVEPSQYVDGPLQMFFLVLKLGATTVNPFDANGFVPAGAIQTIDLTSAGSSYPLITPSISVSGMAHAGCEGCEVKLGDLLSVHMSMQTMSEAVPATTFQTTCNIQVSRIK